MTSNENPHREDGGFDARIVLGFVLCTLGVALAMLGLAAPLPAPPFHPTVIRKGEVVVPSQFVGDLRKLPQSVAAEETRLSIGNHLQFQGYHWTSRTLPESVRATVTQASTASAPMPAPAISFDGMDFNSNGDTHPPDPVGDVGPNYFVQAVN